MTRRMSIIIGVILIAIVGIGIAQATSISGNVTLTCSGIEGSAATATLDRDNTGTGQEAYSIRVVDGASNELFSFAGSLPVGMTLPFGAAPYTTPPQYNPITLTITSLAGNGLPEVVSFSAQGNCAGLPTLDSGCTLDIPDGSVVGEAPLGAPAYSSPGEATNITLNPGTYIVVGQDESETYYKVVLACQFLWVRKDTMQPSFLPPQNGDALPTRIVN